MKALGIKRYIRTYFDFLKAKIKVELEYRANLFIQLLGNLTIFVTNIIFVDVLFSQFNEIAGYTRNEVIFIFGIYTIVRILYDVFLTRGIMDISSAIIDGEFDFYVQKPINTIFLFIVNGFQVFKLSDIFTGGIFLWIAVPNLILHFSLEIIVAFFLAIMLGGVILTSISISLFSLTHWLGDIHHAYWMVSNFSELGKYPRSAYQAGYNIVFGYVVPFVLIGSVPAGLLLGKVEPSSVVVYFLIAIVWALIATFIWKRGMKVYTSAGG